MTQMTKEELAILQKRTKAQWRFWILLQDDQNRSLSVVELCRRAGYAGTKQWFTALKDEGFRAELENSEYRLDEKKSSCLVQCR